ncbi:hypothetical protein GCM10010109_39190 [Actinoplanes campanulatus]|nr:hypothetical protein GCM10010109_39190 [Actinoplanes campanulatus]GID34778.1 hypothetical protein Aca09nite_12840 [Actinoplanes campanulatus]
MTGCCRPPPSPTSFRLFAAYRTWPAGDRLSDFPAAQELDGSVDTVMEQPTVPLGEAGEVLNRSEPQRQDGEQVHVVCPMVIPAAGGDPHRRRQ